MLPEWSAVFDVRPFSVFGRTLPPLTLGSLFLLMEIESPLLSGKQATADDVLLAAYLASHQHETARQMLRREQIMTDFVAWGRQWGESLALNATDRAAAVEAECTRFRDYIGHWLRAPKRWKKHRDAAANGTATPWPVFLVAELRRHFGMTDAEAWAMPCAKAFAYYAAVCEAHGDKDLITSTDAAAIARVTAGASAP